MTVNGAADYANVRLVTVDFFAALGVNARIGRLMSPEEHVSGSTIPAVVTDAFWRSRLGADPKAIGSTIKFGPRPAIVIGVLPPGVRFPARADVYMPSRIFPETPTRGGHNYQVIGRLRDGVSIEQARDDMTAIARRLEKEYPQTNDGKMVALLPLKDNLVGNTRQMLMVLLAAVSFVLLIACANVANLLLARATARGREMVVRASVGAARWRLVQQLVTESLTLGVIAGVAGVSLAYVGVRALTAVAPQDLPRVEEIGLDRMALWFTLMISVASSVIFGLAPALQVSRVRLVEGLRQGGKGSALGARAGWTRQAFVVVQVALAVVLVVAAGLLGRSLAALAAVDLGFNSRSAARASDDGADRRLRDFPRAAAVYRDVIKDLRAVPGVSSVGGVTSVPTQVRSPAGMGAGRTDARTARHQFAHRDLQRRHARLLPRDADSSSQRPGLHRRRPPGAQPVAIINEALARAAFPGQDPLGRWI